MSSVRNWLQRIPLIGKVFLAFVLAIPTAFAVGASPGIAAAAGHGPFTQLASCPVGTNCVMMPPLASGGPDQTGGANDQSDELMTHLYFYSVVSPHTAANPLTIMLQPGGVYHSDYTLRLANLLQATDEMWPNFPTFNLDYTTIDLNGSKIDQRLWQDNAKTDVIGNAIISTGGAAHVTIKNGTLENTGFIGHSRGANVEDWQGIRVGGNDAGHYSSFLNMTNLTIKRPGGDNVQMGGPIDDITVQNSIMNNTGRHNITFNGGTDLFFLNNELHFGRFIFDSEPGGGVEIGRVWIAGNTAEGANFGFLQSQEAPSNNIHDFVIANNSVVGVGGILLSSPNAARSGLTYSGNTLTCWAKNSGAGTAHPVNTIGWSNVNVSNNTFNVVSGSWSNRFPQIDPYTGGPPPTGVVTTPNTYTNC